MALATMPSLSKTITTRPSPNSMKPQKIAFPIDAKPWKSSTGTLEMLCGNKLRYYVDGYNLLFRLSNRMKSCRSAATEFLEALKRKGRSPPAASHQLSLILSISLGEATRI